MKSQQGAPLETKNVQSDQINEKLNNQQREFQQLVNELMKNRPNSTRVKKLTEKLGLPYHLDPIEQLDFVLKTANTFFLEDPPQTKARK